MLGLTTDQLTFIGHSLTVSLQLLLVGAIVPLLLRNRHLVYMFAHCNL